MAKLQIRTGIAVFDRKKQKSVHAYLAATAAGSGKKMRDPKMIATKIKNASNAFEIVRLALLFNFSAIIYFISIFSGNYTINIDMLGR